MKTKNELIEEYYRNNPEVEVRDEKSKIIEFLGPTLAGGAIGALAPRVPYMPKNPTAGMGYGLAVALPLSATRRAHRRKKILAEMGIDESLLGSFAEPLKREI